jgi:hypothetical protein
MFRICVTLAAAMVALALAGVASAGGNASASWNAKHLPSPAPGYLPPSDTGAWNATHLPSPAPGYLPQTVRTSVAFVRVPAPSGFHLRDAAIGAAFSAFALAVLGGAVLVAIRARREVAA